jgi:excinuclease ABC subunit A
MSHEPTRTTVLIQGAREHNLRNITVEVPRDKLVVITGVSGSGKSSLAFDTLYAEGQRRLLASMSAFAKRFVNQLRKPDVEFVHGLSPVISIDQKTVGSNPRSTVGTLTDLWDYLRMLYATLGTPHCPRCAQPVLINLPLAGPRAPTRRRMSEFMIQSGSSSRWRRRNIAEVLKLSIEESVAFFADQRGIIRKLEILHELGLGYLELGHAATILSGGEAQRVKLAAELGKMRRGRHNLYILDEPTTGLHLADIQRLLDCLQRLVDAGHSVLVIEHHLDVIKCADWILDLGPEGGHQGGQLIVAGTPNTVAASQRSHTGRALRRYLERVKTWNQTELVAQ